MNKELKGKISKDIYRYYGQNKIPLKEKILPYNLGLKYIILFRKANYYCKKNHPLKYFYELKLKYKSIKLGFQINPSTNIGDGFYLGHIGNTIINPEAVIGKNVSLAQGVTIGSHVRGLRKGVPTIGNMVYIGANSVVVGKINIGDDVLIAPNTFVNFDVPSHSIVVGSPGKITSRENATYGFLVYTV